MAHLREAVLVRRVATIFSMIVVRHDWWQKEL